MQIRCEELCFAPLDQTDDCLYGYLRYEVGTLNNPQPIKDGFYAFIAVAGPSDECQQVPGYLQNQWYESNEDNDLVPAAEPISIDSTGWYCYRHEDNPYAFYARICPVHELLDDENRVGSLLGEWTRGAMEQALQLWRALFEEEELTP